MTDVPTINANVVQKDDKVTVEVSGFTPMQAVAFAMMVAPHLQAAIADVMGGPSANGPFQPQVVCGCSKCRAERGESTKH